MIRRKKNNVPILIIVFLLIIIFLQSLYIIKVNSLFKQLDSLNHISKQVAHLNNLTLKNNMLISHLITRMHDIMTSYQQNLSKNYASNELNYNYSAFTKITTRTIPIVAVSSDGKGVIGKLEVKLIPGNNNVFIETNPFSQEDLQYSLNKAVLVAKLKVKNYKYDKDFVFSYHTDANVIGGESAGAAATIAIIAALTNSKLKNDCVITGTIEPDGTIGKVAGLIEKAFAVAKANYSCFLIPYGQSKIRYYEKVVKPINIVRGFTILNTYYEPKEINLVEIAKKEWNLTVIEVKTIDEALKYFIS